MRSFGDYVRDCNLNKVYNAVKSYAMPDAKWRLGICNFATHVKPELKVGTVKVNPLKASKRASSR